MYSLPTTTKILLGTFALSAIVFVGVYTQTENALQGQISESGTGTVLDRVFYRGGERVEIGRPAAPTAVEETSTIEEIDKGSGALLEENIVEDTDPVFSLENEQMEESTEEDLMLDVDDPKEEETSDTTSEDEDPDQEPVIEATVLNTGLDFMQIIGIMAIIGAVLFGSVLYFFTKKKSVMPAIHQEEVIPAPPEEASSTRLQEVIEEIKKEESTDETPPVA